MTNFQSKTRRERLIELLKTAGKSGMSLPDLSDILEATTPVLIEDLKSITKSSKYKEYFLMVSPPTCINCGFKFKKSLNPSKCPKCRRTRIETAIVALIMKKRRRKS
jgi:predicted Zn-ribbon and HTH transcriptional regulator